MTKSNPQFQRIVSSQEYETFTFPKELLYNTKISGNALKLMLTILDFGKRPNWQIRQNHLISVTGFKYDKYNAAIKCLINAGYVKRTRIRIKGKWQPYEYQFCAFPIFLEKTQEEKPVGVFQSGFSGLENPDFTYSTNDVLEDTTNPSQEKPKEKELVGSSFEKLKELEDIPKISKSQKTTLYKKFTHEEILNGLKSIDIQKADSVFGLLYTAIKEKYSGKSKSPIHAECYEIYEEANRYLKKYDRITLGIDENNAYIYAGTAISTFSMRDSEFKNKFVAGVKNTVKNMYNI